MTLNRGQRRTLAVVGLVIGAALVLTFRQILPSWAFYGALIALAYEGYTLVDGFTGNTLSEGIWLLSRRPLVPVLFGMAAGAGLATGFFSTAVAFGVGFLYGHFFFQSTSVYDSLWVLQQAVEKAVEKAVEGVIEKRAE